MRPDSNRRRPVALESALAVAPPELKRSVRKSTARRCPCGAGRPSPLTTAAGITVRRVISHKLGEPMALTGRELRHIQLLLDVVKMGPWQDSPMLEHSHHDAGMDADRLGELVYLTSRTRPS